MAQEHAAVGSRVTLQQGAVMWSLRELFKDVPMVHVLDVGERPIYQGLVDSGAARISGFEPTASECDKLNAKYGAPHQFFPTFVGDGKVGTFHETSWSLTGSLLEPNQPLNEKFQQLAELTALKAKHEVQTTRLDDVAGLLDVDFIKIDVQGAELMIFEHAPRVLSEAVLIQTEVEFLPLYKEQPLFGDVDRHLRTAGFQLHTFLGFGQRAFKPLVKNKQPHLGFRQLLWSDAVYARDFMRLAELSEPKLKKLALLLHDLYESLDLCHLVLEELDRKSGLTWAPRYLQRLTGTGPKR
jgi:FkbM family methyltransferase